MTATVHTGAEKALARRLLSQRREREELLGPELASDPAWTMLLALFIAHEEGKPAAVISLCDEAGTPPVTALRWLTALANEGKVTWWTATQDPQRARVDLAPDLADRLREMFRTWIDQSG